METADTFSRYEHRNTAGRVAYQLGNRQVLIPCLDAQGGEDFRLGIKFTEGQEGHEGTLALTSLRELVVGATILHLDTLPPDAPPRDSNEATWFRLPFESLWVDLPPWNMGLLILDVSSEGPGQAWGDLEEPRLLIYVFTSHYKPELRKDIGTYWATVFRAAVVMGMKDDLVHNAAPDGFGDITFHVEGHIDACTNVCLCVRDIVYLLNVVSNVKLEKVPPANRVPKHERRYPKLDYHIITVGRHGRGAVSPRLVEQLRQSPRQHLRRGHLRHLSTGSVAWVRPCIVGDAEKGMIVHDYQTA